MVRLLILNDSAWHARPIVRQLSTRRRTLTSRRHPAVSDEHRSVWLRHKGVLLLILFFIFTFDLNGDVLG